MLLATATARADDSSEIEFARTRNSAGLFDESIRRLLVMLDPAKPSCDKGPSGNCRLTDPDLIEEARGMAVIALIALGRQGEADEQIEKIFLKNPAFKARPPMFPLKVADRFNEIRNGPRKAEFDALLTKRADIEHLKQVYEQQYRDWLAEIQRMAAEETIVQRNSRLISLIPFGVGQFQNGGDRDTVFGYIFAISEGLLATGTLVTTGIVIQSSGIDTKQVTAETGLPPDTEKLNNRIATAAALNRVFFAAWAGVTVAGILQAQIAFVPERELPPRKRPIPTAPKPPVLPSVSVLPGGAMIGVTGRF